MNQHTPQEWADITGCYVARDQLRERFTLFKNKPEINHEEGLWCQAGDWGELPVGAVPKEFRALDWTTLYEPRKADNAPHQSEVFVHKEYKLIPAFEPVLLENSVSARLNDGFTLYGNPFVVEDKAYGSMIIQAMVRGL